jgi:predicted dienelactone hydrolase
MSITQSASGVPSAPSVPVVSVGPVALPAPGRGDELQVRVTAPATGCDIPVIVFSHGFGSSMDGYAPLVDIWAANGFAVLQPTHLDSATLDLAPEDPRTPLIWRFRIDDLTCLLDGLDLIEASVPGLGGRLDRQRLAVAATRGAPRPPAHRPGRGQRRAECPPRRADRTWTVHPVGRLESK